MINGYTNMTQEEAIKEISEWANASHAYLCNREGYPLGYKNGISQAKIIVLGILSQIDVKQDKSKKRNNMCVNLRIGKVYQVELSDVVLSGNESKDAMYDLFGEFEISHNADDEFDNDYDLDRSELQRFRDEVAGHTEYFQERAGYFAEKLKIMNITEEQFIKVLDRLINESDQTNGQILLTWY